MASINSKIRTVRPKLSKIAPFTYRVVQGFTALNFCLALALHLQARTLHLAIANTPFANEAWAAIFLMIGVSLLVGLIRNDWGLMRYTLITGLLAKTLWAYALIALGFQIGLSSIVGTIGLWLMVAWTQAWLIIFFVPRTNDAR